MDAQVRITMIPLDDKEEWNREARHQAERQLLKRVKKEDSRYYTDKFPSPTPDLMLVKHFAYVRLNSKGDFAKDNESVARIVKVPSFSQLPYLNW
jgi:hypothetical protein